MKPYSGLGVALVTPFDEKGNIDLQAFEKLVNQTIAGKVDYIVLFGTTGESATVDFQEKKETLEAVATIINGRVPLVLGMGGNNTRKLLQEFDQIDLNKVDAVLSVCPYYNKPSQQGMFEHFKAIAEKSPKPVIAYNVPGRTVVNIEASTTLRMAAEIPNIIALKEATDDLDQLMDLKSGAPAGFSILSGDDSLALSFIALGADGLISVIANAFPAEFSKLVHAALDNDIATARRYHYLLLPLMHTMLKMGNPASVKALLCMQGIIKENFRLPLVPMCRENFSTLEKVFTETCKKIETNSF